MGPHHLQVGSIFKLDAYKSSEKGAGYIPAPQIDWSFAHGKLFEVVQCHNERAWNYVHGLPLNQNVADEIWQVLFREKRVPSKDEWHDVLRHGFVIDGNCIVDPVECDCGNKILVEDDYLCAVCRART